MAASFIASGWPLLFETPKMYCYTDYSHTDFYECTETQACKLNNSVINIKIKLI